MMSHPLSGHGQVSQINGLVTWSAAETSHLQPGLHTLSKITAWAVNLLIKCGLVSGSGVQTIILDININSLQVLSVWAGLEYTWDC